MNSNIQFEYLKLSIIQVEGEGEGARKSLSESMELDEGARKSLSEGKGLGEGAGMSLSHELPYSNSNMNGEINS